MITQEKLKAILIYDTDTGVFIRRKDAGIAGSVRTDGYIAIGIDYVLYMAHRLAFLYMTGEVPSGEVDHINGNRADNRWLNLRACTREQNRMNLGVYKNSTTNISGVTWHRRTGKWQARIGKDGRRLHLGYFDSVADAMTARVEAQCRIYGEFARRP